MNLLELIKKRCSIRQYASTPIEEEKLEYVLEAGRLAPSAVNFQPWYFIVVREQEECNLLRECYHREWFASAPTYIIICKDDQQSWKRSSDGKDHGDIDAAIAIEHMALAATEQGLATCWVCNFDISRCKENFGIPEHVQPVALLPIGYPAQPTLFEQTPKKRKALSEIVKKERF